MKHAPKGYTLIVVLWVVALLTLAFGFFYERVGLAISSTRRLRSEFAARELAHAGFEAAAGLLARDANGWDSLGEDWAKPEGHTVSSGLGRVCFRIYDEGSKINLNTAEPAILAKIPDLDQEKLEALLDWRDVDDDPRPLGAESGFYRGLDPGYECRNGPFEVPGELAMVKGFDKQLVDRLRPEVTTFGLYNVDSACVDGLDALMISRGVDKFAAMFVANDIAAYRDSNPPPAGSVREWAAKIPRLSPDILDRLKDDLTAEGTINVNTAPVPVLKAVFAGLGISRELADKLKDVRDQAAFAELAAVKAVVADEAAWRKLQGYLSVSSSYFRIESTGQEPGGRSATVRAVVWRMKQAQAGGMWRIKVLSWEE